MSFQFQFPASVLVPVLTSVIYLVLADLYLAQTAVRILATDSSKVFASDLLYERYLLAINRLMITLILGIECLFGMPQNVRGQT